MLKPLLAIAVLFVPLAVLAQGLEPGEWEFNSVTSSPLFPGGHLLGLLLLIKFCVVIGYPNSSVRETTSCRPEWFIG